MFHAMNPVRHGPFSVIEPLEGRQLLSGTLFSQHNLVSDGAVSADHVDKNLVNPWGLADNSAGGPAWVANNGTSTTTLYKYADGSSVGSAINIPGAIGAKGAPTGTVFNGNTKSFIIHKGSKSENAYFLFASEDGGISGWSDGVDLHNAVLVINNSSTGAIYKGLTSAASKGHDYLYAANFGNGRVDVWDSKFKSVSTFGTFLDPKVPAGYAPFNVQNIGGKIYVTYAKKTPGQKDEMHGDGLGYVSVFSPEGKVLSRLQHGAYFNAPWGVAKAPKGFKELAGDILVGQFGSGKIEAFNSSGKAVGFLNGTNGKALTIDGLWAIRPGDAAATANTLFFTAGINGEADGLFGSISVKGKKSSSGGTGSGY